MTYRDSWGEAFEGWAQSVVDSATAPLNTQIADLQAHVADLDAQILDLDAQIESLQDELAHADPAPTLFGAFAGQDTVPAVGGKATWRADVAARFGVSSLPVERIYWSSLASTPLGAGPLVASVSLSASELPGVSTGASQDAVDAMLERLKDYRFTVWLTLTHEPENNGKALPEELVPALKALQARRDAVGATNVKVGPILMGYTEYHDPDLVDSYTFLEMDFLGFDAYFRPNGPSRADAVYMPLLNAARSYAVPLVIGETSLGYVGDGGNGFTEAEWTRNVQEMIPLLALPGEVAAVCFFEVNKSDGDWRLVNHPEALSAYKVAVSLSS